MRWQSSPCPAVHHHRVAFVREPEQRIELRALCAFPRRFVGEQLVHLDVFQLPFRVLDEVAGADVTNALPLQDAFKIKMSGRDLWPCAASVKKLQTWLYSDACACAS